MKKLARIIIICILIIGVIVTIIVLKNNKKDTGIAYDTNNYDIDEPLEGYEEDEEEIEKEDFLDEATFNELIKIAKETELSGTYYYSKFVEIGREEKENEIDRYVWAQYGRTNEEQQEESATSIPLKIRISLTDYSIISRDVPPDNTDYKKYFPKVAEDLEAMDNIDKKEMYDEVFYGM